MEQNNNNRVGGTTPDKGYRFNLAELFATVQQDDYEHKSLVQLSLAKPAGSLAAGSLSLARTICGGHGRVGVVMEAGEGLEWQWRVGEGLGLARVTVVRTDDNRDTDEEIRREWGGVGRTSDVGGGWLGGLFSNFHVG
ncbi:hypothetical protein Acr_00g0035850 [Actinidia rufa]|uniref:Uncharacterized protein n=1 Tax=Actinidia rufa TaxID=165716 RepID=A0A7J0DI98_9ERIC|nr:hypothetical protein Acr_00g0035850 [Actinidia rufa]